MGDIAGEALGFQEHACGHLCPPTPHWLPEDAVRNTLFAEMGCQSQSVGTGSDD
jgi:hypothetical protein